MNLNTNYYEGSYQNDIKDNNTYNKKDDYSFSNKNQVFKSNGSSNSYEFNTEKETIQILKAQNKRMLDLTNELERKEQLLSSMQQQLTSYESFKMQAENYKRQIMILEEKLSLANENESKSEYYNQQLKNISEAENRLRNQIISKDKIIYDYDKTIKEQEKTIALLRKQALEKEGIINNLKQDLNECNSKAKNISSKLENDKEDIRRMREDYERMIAELSREKQRMEEKTTELIDIIKQQSKELNEYNVQIQIAEKEKKIAAKQNQAYQREIEELLNNQGNLKEQLMALKEVKVRLSEADEKSNYIISENEQVKKTNSMLQRNMQEISDKYNELRHKYTGENSPEKLRLVIESLEKEIYNLKQNNDNIFKFSKHNESRTLQLEGEIKEIIKNINFDIKNIISWIDNHFGNFSGRNNDIPEPQITSNSFIKSNIHLESLKSSLCTVRRTILAELIKGDNLTREVKKENNTLLLKNETLSKEVSNLKNDQLKKIDDIYNLNQELQKYASEITSVQKEEYKIKNEFYDKTEQYNKFIDKIYDKLKVAINGVYENPRISKLYNDTTIQMTFNDNKNVLVENLIDKFFEIFNNVANEYENLIKLNDNYMKYKIEAERLRKELHEIKKTLKDDNERFLKEKSDISKKYEKLKFEEVSNMENSLKLNNDKIKHKLIEKDEIIEQLKMENSIIRNQLELIDKNLNNYKASRTTIE